MIGSVQLTTKTEHFMLQAFFFINLLKHFYLGRKKTSNVLKNVLLFKIP